MTENIERETLKGSLQRLPFPKTINYVQQSEKTGILAITRGPKKLHIHFLKGAIVFVTSSYFPNYSLGEYLVTQGKITPEISRESYQKTRGGKTKQGTYLVEQGHLSPHELFEALNEHVTRKLFHLFTWLEGDFYFKEGEIIGQEDRILKIDVPNLIYVGIRDHYPLKTLPPEFRGRKESPLHHRQDCRHRVESMAFGPAGTRVYSVVNGVRTLRQIVASTKLKKSAAYKSLYGMYLLGFVGFPESQYKKQEELLSFQEKAQLAHDTKIAQKKEGYEINMSDDIIAEALKSVDRVHSQFAAANGEEEAKTGAAALEPASLEIDAPSKTAKPEAPAESMEGTTEGDELLPTGPMSVSSETKTSPQAFDAPATEAAGTSGSAEDESSGLSLEGVEDILSAPSPTPEAPPPKSGDAAATSGFEDLSFGDSDEEFQWEEVAEEPPGDEVKGADTRSDEVGGGSAESVELSTVPKEAVKDLVKSAVILMKNDNFDEAKNKLTLAIEADPGYAEAYPHLGWCIYHRSGGSDFDEADKIIKEGIKLDPKSYIPCLYLGKIYKHQNQLDFAELYFVKALELNVECVEAKEEIKKLHQKK